MRNHFRSAALAKGHFLLTLARASGIRINSSIEARVGEHLDSLKRRYESFVARRVVDLTAGSPQSHVIWVISTYQHTLFSCLCFASLLPSLNQRSYILLGGDPIDEETAPEIVSNLPWVDGAVVGAGERTLAQVLIAQGGREVDS